MLMNVQLLCAWQCAILAFALPTGLLELLGPLEAGRVADAFFCTWQWCFLDWQRMFGQAAVGW